MNSELTSLIKKQSLAFLAASFVISALLMTVGFLLGENTFIGPLFIAIGGGALGACIGLVMSSIIDASGLTHIKELVANTLQSDIYSDRENLVHFRKVWHHYIQTKVEDRETWRYRKVDFSLIDVPGKLLASLSVPRPAGGYSTYRIEGYLVGLRLILVQRPEGGAEPHVVQIFPQAGEQFHNVHAGVCVLKTWDAEGFLSPVLMSPTPIWEGSEGTIPDSENDRLNKLWRKSFSAGQSISSVLAGDE
ncbi:hypothetical protein [Erythrobacter sp. JK5]|uniref:hypothetical protein n=1 Tax=Erythrobacter sp. JK5 TaxID=2829500 RepID=UPI001BADA362|nr:hypothetical protein [Erythrobacter sp. JK5]QUL38182.1 hypothetical protein KDC96_01800 [Erythrobacter sp. JK5]